MTIYNLYNGDIQLEFGTKVGSKGRKKSGYWIDDREVLRVTSVGVPFPFAGACWYGAGLAKAKFLSMAEGQMDLDEDLVIHGEDLPAWGEELRRAAGDTTARDRGTAGHQCIEDYLEVGDFHVPDEFPELEERVMDFSVWWEKQETEVFATEQKVYSKEFRYAGTLDLDAKINGMRAIVDYKFGKIRPSVKTQTAAYQNAREEEHGYHYDHRMVISLTEDGIKTEVFEEQEKDFSAFKNLLEYHRWLGG